MIGKVTTETMPKEQLEQLEKLRSEPLSEAEVGGRNIQHRLARCSSCGYIGWISYDPAATCQMKVCDSCGALLIF